MHEPRVAIVPVRAASPKSRLAGVLEPAARVRLTYELFDHVVGCLVDAGLRVVALHRGRVELPVGIEALEDQERSLNGSLDRTVGLVGTPALVVAADLPWLTPSAVHELIEERTDVVVAGTRDGGTGGLLLRRPIPFAFGPSSALAHARAAHRSGLSARLVRVRGFDRDLDEPADLWSALRSSPALTRDAGIVWTGPSGREDAGTSRVPASWRR